MISKEERRYLILKVVAIVLLSLIMLSMVRVLFFDSDFIHSGLLHTIFLKEIIFSVSYALFICLILYLMISEDVRHIKSKAFNYAYTDGLTGLYNRHYLNNFLQKFTLMSKKDANFAIAFIDIDKFKDINDTQGHSSGDCILKSLALILKSLTEEKDTLCRYGGEEFLIICNEITKYDAFKKMEHIRETVQERYFHCEHNRITISIGLSLGTRDDDVDKIIQEADRALYIAKNAGRNCVKLFDKEDKNS